MNNSFDVEPGLLTLHNRTIIGGTTLPSWISLFHTFAMVEGRSQKRRNAVFLDAAQEGSEVELGNHKHRALWQRQFP